MLVINIMCIYWDLPLLRSDLKDLAGGEALPAHLLFSYRLPTRGLNTFGPLPNASFTHLQKKIALPVSNWPLGSCLFVSWVLKQFSCLCDTATCNWIVPQCGFKFTAQSRDHNLISLSFLRCCFVILFLRTTCKCIDNIHSSSSFLHNLWPGQTQKNKSEMCNSSVKSSGDDSSTS